MPKFPRSCQISSQISAGSAKFVDMGSEQSLITSFNFDLIFIEEHNNLEAFQIHLRQYTSFSKTYRAQNVSCPATKYLNAKKVYKKECFYSFQ